MTSLVRKNSNTTASSGISNSTYEGIQLLRFVAAAAVLLPHASMVLREKFDFYNFPILDSGLAGVHIFFAISGFVMALSAEPLIGVKDSWLIFCKRRLIRLVPIYWIATTLKLFVVLALPALATHSEFDPIHTFASYFFIHMRDEAGNISPLHAVGWTLNYEMFFYSLIAIGLYLGKRPLFFVSSAFLLLSGVGSFFDIKTSGGFIAYMQPILLIFVLGMLLGYVCLMQLKPNFLVASLLLLTGVFTLTAMNVPHNALGWSSFLMIGIPSTLIVSGIAFLEPLLQKRIPLALRELGDSSYSLYLFHPFILAAIAIAAKNLNIISSSTIFTLMIFSSIIGSWIIYRFLERPLTQTLKKHSQMR